METNICKIIWYFRILFGPLYRKIFNNNKTLWCTGNQTNVMNKKQSEFLQSCIDNSIINIQQLQELKSSGVKLTQVQKYDLEYYHIKRTIITNLKNQLGTIK